MMIALISERLSPEFHWFGWRLAPASWLSVGISCPLLDLAEKNEFSLPAKELMEVKDFHLI